MNFSLEHVPKKIAFILFHTQVLNYVSRSCDLEFAALIFADLLCLSPDRAKLRDTRAHFSIGWFNAVVDWSITSLNIASDSPFVQWEPKEYKNVVFVVFFFLPFVVLLGNSRTSAVFSLLLLLEIQQRNISIKYSLFKWTNCSLSYLYAY